MIRHQSGGGGGGAGSGFSLKGFSRILAKTGLGRPRTGQGPKSRPH